MNEEPISQEDEAREDELFATGDARRCPHHPSQATSTPDGMFDFPCGECEHASEVAATEWEYDLSNPSRRYCGFEAPCCFPIDHRGGTACTDVEDNIPF